MAIDLYSQIAQVVVLHTFQRSSPLKPLVQSMPNFMWSILRMGGLKFYINGLGHMIKMAAMSIYDNKSCRRTACSTASDLCQA